jgi:hypothetical protein
MLHVHVSILQILAALPCCMFTMNVQVASCYTSMLHVHTACPRCTAMLHIHAACQCWLFIMHIQSACAFCMPMMPVLASCPFSMYIVYSMSHTACCPCCISMLHVQVVCPCCMSMLHTHAACPYYYLSACPCLLPACPCLLAACPNYGCPILKVRNCISAKLFSPHLRYRFMCPQYCESAYYSCKYPPLSYRSLCKVYRK